MSEWGESALITLIFISGLQAFLPLFLQKKQAMMVLRYAFISQCFQFFLISISFLSLIYAYVKNDTTLINVVENSHHSTPLLYKITGVWGNHEGSMILWEFILILYGMMVAILTTCEGRLKTRFLCIQSFLACLFSLFIYLTSNPFQKMDTPFSIGKDLNPILQDPALAFHPPTLYLGLLGFSVVFSFALAALWENDREGKWIQEARPWALVAWSFLSIGITIGSWWAYYELGWGGWWFWDPVENVSLMPWLTGTALLHTFVVVQSQKHLMRWCYFLSLLTFLVAVGGAFLVRSGILSSIHTFASDPWRGQFLLIILLSITFISLGPFLVRFKNLVEESSPLIFQPKAGSILMNNHLLVTLAMTVTLGTFYPLLIDAITGQTITVGSPYFAFTFVPLSFVVLGLMGFSSWLGKACQTWQNLNLPLYGPFVLTLGVMLGLLYQGYHYGRAMIAIALSLWVITSTLKAVYMRGLRISWSMTCAHCGLAMAVLGMGVDSLGVQEKLVALKSGESLIFQEFQITLQSVERKKMPTYEADQAIIEVKKNQVLTILHPEKRFYPTHQTLTTETALYHFWFSNLYFALGSFLSDGRWTLRIYYHPWVELIWLGGLIMALGGFVGVISYLRRKSLRWKVMIALGLSFTLPSKAVEIGERLLDPALEQRARDLSAEIKCPVCVGQSIDDSYAPLARALRQTLREALLEGQTNEQIRCHLTQIYGEEILFKPYFDLKNSFLWCLPFFITFLGFAWIVNRIGRKVNLKDD